MPRGEKLCECKGIGVTAIPCALCLALAKRRAKARPRPTIIVDQQEKTPLTRYFDPELVKVESAHLETGDYSLAGATHLLAIERKGLPDLLGCCTHDRERFMDQMRRMKNYPSRFLIVEATREAIEAEAYRPNVRASSVINALLGIGVRWNVCVQYCDGPKEAARMVTWIVRKVAQLQAEGFYDNLELKERGDEVQSDSDLPKLAE